MATAIVALYEGTGAATGGAATTNTSVDGSTITFGLSDAVTATGSVHVPASAGTNYSYVKSLFLDITTAATSSTNLLNRTVKINTASPTGLTYFWAAVAKGAYAQATAAPTANGSTNGAAPAGFTAITTTATSYDATTSASTATGQNGAYCTVVAGVDATYAAGGGTSATTTITLGYDEQ